MSKITAVVLLVFLLVASVSHASRPLPRSENNQIEVAEVAKIDSTEGCEGASQEECLARRTLNAHVDYIYTQGNKHR